MHLLMLGKAPQLQWLRSLPRQLQIQRLAEKSTVPFYRNTGRAARNTGTRANDKILQTPPLPTRDTRICKGKYNPFPISSKSILIPNSPAPSV